MPQTHEPKHRAKTAPINKTELDRWIAAARASLQCAASLPVGDRAYYLLEAQRQIEGALLCYFPKGKR